MYGRNYGDRELRFEPSGGLLHASLVMQDKETDSYWSIMTGDALAGEYKGTRLDEIPIGVKARWGDWKAEHPETLVLSVDGEEHVENNPYDNYFASEEGFRGLRASDHRLPTKASIYSFQSQGGAYAVPFSEFEGGASFSLGDMQVFLYRPEGEAIFYSTLAYIASEGGFQVQDGVWHHDPSGARFDPAQGGFVGGEGAVPKRLHGFDTFWFNWSMIHTDSKILRR